MQKPTLYLDGSHFTLGPGEAVETTLTLAKTGTRVNQYRIFIPKHCPASQFATFRESPEQHWTNQIKVSLVDASQAVVEVKFEASEDRRSKPGASHFVIAVEALDEGQRSSAVEGVLEITAIAGIEAKVDKPRRRSRRSAAFSLAVTNTGTATDHVRLVAEAFDADEMSVDFRPGDTDIGAGDHRLFTISVSARRPIVVGKPTVHSATLSVRPNSGAELPPHVIEWEQRPWLPKFAVVLAVLAIGGIVAWQLRPGPAELGTPPDPPTGLTATPDVEEASLRWTPGERSVSTEIRTVDCYDLESLTATALTRAEFSEVSSGVVPLPVDDSPVVCFQARSLDGEGQASVWSAGIDAERVSTELPVPQNLALEGSVLTWEAVSDYGYELIVIEGPTVNGVEVGLDLSRLELAPGQHEIVLRSRRGEDYSGTSDPVLYIVEGLPPTTTPDPTSTTRDTTSTSGDTTTTSEEPPTSTSSPPFPAPEKPLPLTPWLLLYLETDQLPTATERTIRQYIELLYDEEDIDLANIQTFRIAPDTDESITVQLGAGAPLPLAGQWVVGDLLTGQTPEEAAAICAQLRPIMQAQAPAGLATFCFAFDGAGNQLPDPSTNGGDE